MSTRSGVANTAVIATLCRRIRRSAALALAAMLALVPAAWAQDPDDSELVAIGRRIYREGVLPSGQPLRGLAQAGVSLSGKGAACANCHRRSGYGVSEGPIEVRSITAPALFGTALELPGSPAGWAPGADAGAPAGRDKGADRPAAEVARANALALRSARAAAFAGNRLRPPYDDPNLARAIRNGIDSSGRALSPAMPRFDLAPRELAALTAYLKTLSVSASPGITGDAVHFATVIQPGVDPVQRQALVEVLQTYMRDRNHSQRSEIRREETGVIRLRRSYREWVLHVWDLRGPETTWTEQLEAYQHQQPAFALVSGLGSTNWQTIHDFSERNELPCIFPQVDLPVLAGSDFYTVYLSRGIALEAQALARFLREANETGPLTQVYRTDDAAGAAAADAFRRDWTAATGNAPVDRGLAARPDAAFWRRLAGESRAGTLVLWLPSQDLDQAQVLAAVDTPIAAIYLSGSLNSGARSGLAADASGRVRMVYPLDLPTAREARVEVARRWMRSKGITPVDEKVQMNAYLAATVLGLAMAHNVDTYSRDYLLEFMEHRLGTALELSLYPRLSLGPGQRFASKGSYIVKVGGANDRQLQALSEWIVPW